MGNASSRKKKQTSGAEHANSPVVEGGKLPATTGGIPSMVHFSSAKDTLESQPASANSPAYACSSVQGKRIGMEDRHIAVRPLYVDRTASANLFGVFDGHGGSTVSSFLSQNMAGAVSWSVQSALTNRTGVEKGLKEAFRQVDAAFLRSTHGNADEGSCAVVVLLQGDKVRLITCVQQSLLLFGEIQPRESPKRETQLCSDALFFVSTVPSFWAGLLRKCGRLACSSCQKGRKHTSAVQRS